MPFQPTVNDINKQIFNVDSNLQKGNIQFIGTGRVLKTIFGDNESDPDFVQNGQWKTVGAIKYELISEQKVTDILNVSGEQIVKPERFNIAFPFNAHIQSFPVVNELVMLFTGPSLDLSEGKGFTSVYYLGPFSIWRNSNHEAFPYIPRLKSQQDNIPSGSINPTDLYGPDFLETNIPTLRPFNGDILHIGRFGQSIRFGHTTPDKRGQNKYSETGSVTDPITIISNQIIPSSKDFFAPLAEDLNRDGSSLWLTSNQKVEIRWNQSGSVLPSWEKPQAVLSGDRVVILGKEDSTFILGKKTVSISANQKVNIQTPTCTVTSTLVKLGLSEEETGEPTLLGDKTVQQLNDLIDGIKQVADVLAKLTDQQFNKMVPELRSAGEVLANKCTTVQTAIKTQIKSTVTFTK